MSQILTQPISQPLAASAVPRILVVDDEQYMCDVCTRTLQRGGYNVTSTSDPNEAVRALRNENFDLLLTDIKMPTMSGLELAHIARERDPAIAIIIMTGFASIEHLHQSVQRGVADFLSKPFELEHLRLAVDQALHKRSILRDNLRLRAIEQLLESSEALSTTLALPELTSILLSVILKQSACRAGFLLLAEERRNLLASMTASTPEAVLFEDGRQLALQTYDEQQPVSSSGVPFGTLNGDELRYAFAVPLRAQGYAIGVLILCDDTEGSFRPGVQESVMLLANHAGAALRNASLYSQLDVAYQRLQELDRLKGEFISIASHELRTPLSIVLGYTLMVHDQLAGEQREYLHRVMESAQRIKEVVDDMVSLRHLETGEARPFYEPLSAQDLIQQTVDSLRPQVLNHQHEVVLAMPEEPLVFHCDREKLLLILGHLLSNAIKFTPQGGRITVSAAMRTLAELEQQNVPFIPHLPQEPAKWVVISFQDTGIGIPEREQRRIFDRFYQVADSLTRDRGGIGLGLALVRELVIALGGGVWVESREGSGSMFGFALPYVQGVAEQAPQEKVV